MNAGKDYFTDMLAGIRNAYKEYNGYFEISPGDNFIQKTGKYLGRILVLILMVLLSPVLMIGLTIAFAAVF